MHGQGGHSRSLSEGECWPSELRGTWVPFAWGSFGVTAELLLEGNREKLWPEPVSWGGCTGVDHSKAPHTPETAHLRQEVSWSRATSSRHSGSVTFLALSEKRSNSDGEIR